jgi:hypothetical protein
MQTRGSYSGVKRNIEVKTLIVRGNNHSDCAHSCRYCPIGRKRSVITLERYELFVRRVQQWIDIPAIDHGFGTIAACHAGNQVERPISNVTTKSSPVSRPRARRGRST